MATILKKSSFLFPLVLGILIGTMITISITPFLIILPEQQKLIHEKTTFTSTITTDNNGWHPIHVYYGEHSEKEVVLKASAPMQMKQNYNAGSQVDQDRVILALIREYNSGEEKESYFIDLASNDAIQLSNTYQLEKEGGWDGLCIEPNPIYWYRLSHRKCTVAAAFVGGSSDSQEVDVSLTNEEYGGIIGNDMDNTKDDSTTNKNKHDTVANNNNNKKDRYSEKRYTVSLNTVLTKFRVPHNIDYMSLDVEGAESLIMNDFPFKSYTIRFMTVERPKPELQHLLRENGFHYVMMLIFWGETLWVHESVLPILSSEKIQSIVRSSSRFASKQPNKGSLVFNIDTGEYAKK